MTTNTDEPICVLHVDDDRSFCDLTQTVLEQELDGFDVISETDPTAVRSLLADTQVDCVVSDYDMPRLDGIDLLEAVREEYPDIPFILCTGKGTEEIASRAITAGVTDYLQKEGGTDQFTVLANRIANAVEQYRSRIQLEKSQKRLSLFIEQSSLGVVEWDEEFRFARLNEAAEDILGYTEAELRGKQWEAIVPESDRDAVGDVVEQLLDAAGGYHSINENVRGDGERIVCEWHNRVVTDDDGETVAIFSQIQDVTEREKTKERLTEYASTVTWIHETTRELLDTNDREKAAGIAIAGLEQTFQFDVAAIWLADESRTKLTPVAATRRSGELFGELPVYSAEKSSLSWKAYEQQETRVISDMSEEATRHNPETPVTSEIIIPLGEYGVLNIGAESPEQFDKRDAHRLTAWADTVTATLARITQQSQPN